MKTAIIYLNADLAITESAKRVASRICAVLSADYKLRDITTDAYNEIVRQCADTGASHFCCSSPQTAEYGIAVTVTLYGSSTCSPERVFTLARLKLIHAPG